MEPEPSSARYWLIRAYAFLNTTLVEAEHSLAKAAPLVAANSDEAVLLLALQCTVQSAITKNLTAEVLCEQLGKQVQNIEHPIPGAIAGNQWAGYLSARGRFDESRKANREATRLAQLADDRELIAVLRNNQGVDYLIRGFSRQALAQFTSAREAAAELRDPSVTEMLKINIASALIKGGRFAEAHSLIQSVMQTPSYTHNSPMHLIDYVLLARALLGMGQPNQALNTVLPALKSIQPSGWSEHKPLALATVGQAKYALGQHAAGAEYFNQALTQLLAHNDRTRYLQLNVYQIASLRSSGKLFEAKAQLERVLPELEADGPSLVLVDALNERALIHSELGERSSANADRRRAERLSEQIHGAEFEQRLEALNAALALDAKEHQLALAQRDAQAYRLKAESTRQTQQFLIAGAVLFGLIGYLLYSRSLQRRVAETRQQHNEQLEAEVAERTVSLEREMAERLAIEAKQRELEEDLAERDKLRAIGQLTSGVAHDFNNLMTVMTLSAELIEFEDSAHGRSQRRHVTDILEAAATATTITSSLLSYARKQPLRSERINLIEFFDQLLPLFKRTVGEGIDLTTSVSDCCVHADRATLTTAFINLLMNAKEALDGRGIVTITASPTAQSNVEIEIADNGPGMSGTEVERAIEPFYTTKGQGRGTGLGLSMVYGFAKQSEGDLIIQSAEGKGTSVRLLLPQSDAPAERPPTVSLEADEPSPISGTVLVVEDQAHVRRVLCGLLGNLGMQPRHAGSGDEAILALNAGPLPDLLISDVMMPGCTSGQELFIYVRQRYPNLPIVLISGYTNSVEVDATLLQKPFSLDQLRRSIQQAIRSAGGQLANSA